MPTVQHSRERFPAAAHRRGPLSHDLMVQEEMNSCGGLENSFLEDDLMVLSVNVRTLVSNANRQG